MPKQQGTRGERGKVPSGGDAAAARFVLRGVVQGVGMRPFIYRLACAHGLSGTVANSARGVVVDVEGPPGAVDAFERELTLRAPPLARLDGMTREATAPSGAVGFRIVPSLEGAGESTLICPDAAVCEDCVREFLDPGDRRHLYPFINCTNCGPRFSIIEGTPYDRPRTSMRAFTMCARCRAEYDDPIDRRFHAQPNACPACGPSLALVAGGAGAPAGSSAEVATRARSLLKDGLIVAVKGLGGFHIAADATNDVAVRALRERKRRPAKPFALMCRSIEVVRDIAEVGAEEERLLRGASAPVVLLRKRRDAGRRISPAVAPRNAYLGVMLPHAPLHHLLFDDDLAVLVMTSGNAPGEPIVAELSEARDKLAGVADAFLTHDRGIVNRNDDSIVCVEGGRTLTVRRSRGFAPYPVDLECGIERAPDVLACGTELKCSFTVLQGGRAHVSQHVGDMENRATLEFYEEMVGKFVAWFRARPGIVAHDLHPDYLATRFAREYAGAHGAGLVGVQHHHAHIASVMAENGVTEPVVGLALDGTGYGTDGAIWGCEFLVADLAGFERAGHLATVPLPGGDAAVRRPCRVALSHLYAAGGDPLVERSLPLFDGIPAAEIDLVRQQIAKRVNCVDTSSAGRLFDAVSALLGVCREVTYDAQAAIELESLVDAGVSRAYPYELRADGGVIVIDPAPIVGAVAADALAGVAVGECAAAFHNAVVSFSMEAAGRIARERGIRSVALSGGVFQNRFLLRSLVRALESDGLGVLLNKEVPANDGGVSVGQAAVAAWRLVHGGA
jgi:hydrogenase maturation protein HypF